jgi:hypothetical protein
MPTSSSILRADDYRHYVDRFNREDTEDVVNLIPNSESWDWMKSQVPLFACPDPAMEEMYYYRWWTYRKHIKATPAGRVLTEFILPVRHAGESNTVSCALGHHLAEGRWLADQSMLDEYVGFWFRGNAGKPQAHFHKYSQWIAAALLDRAHVTGDTKFIADLLPDLIDDYAIWETEKQLPDGLFWQYDVWDGMEESISGGRKAKNRRPTINSYMFGNSLAIAEIAQRAGKTDVAKSFRGKAEKLKQLVQEKLWDPAAKFFKVLFEDGTLSSAREEIGFIPWCFNLPDKGYESAWIQLIDPQGFWAPFGITTAERRHPQFRSHGVGQCEWDGAVWPFATSQTLNALANVLRHYEQPFVTREHYLEAIQAYVKSQHVDGRPYVGEYLDETTGEWLKGPNPRSRYYNHSTFNDLVITGLVGLVPRADETLEIDPLLPASAWDWFCLDGVHYRGRSLTIFFDRDGARFNRDKGLHVLLGDKMLASEPTLRRITISLPAEGPQ